MGDHQACVQTTRFDEAHDLATLARIHTAGFKSQVLSIHLVQRNGLCAFVERDDDHDRVGTCRPPGQLKGIAGACHLKHHVRAASLGQGAHDLDHVLLFGINRDVAKPALLCQREAGFVNIRRDDDRRAKKPRGHHGCQSRRPRAEHEHHVRRLNLTDACRPIARCQHIANEQRLLIRDRVGDARAAHVCRRHADKLRLTAVDTAAELPAALDAVVDKPSAAKEAITTEALYIHRDAVALLKLFYACARLHDFADELMAQHDALPRARNAAVSNMQIARADGGAGDAHNRVPRLLYRRHGYIRQTHHTFFLVNYRFHVLCLSYFSRLERLCCLFCARNGAV